MEFKIIRNLIKKALYCSISIIDKDGVPHTSPIGSVFIENETQGYFIEMFTTSFKNQTGNQACILAVNTSILYWLKSLIKGRFETPPAVRLIVRVEELREISDIELFRFQRRVRIFRGLKGHKKMWSSAKYVRPFTVESIRPVSIGAMTSHLK